MTVKKTEDNATMATQARRFAWWWSLSIVALVAVMWLAPQQGSVLLYKLAQVAVGLLLAYFADRALFDNGPYVDASMPRDVLSAGRLIARAIVALAIINGLAVGI